MLVLTRLLALGLTLMSLAQAGEKAGHLFILSGQSNMTGNLKKGFQETVTQTLGEEQVAKSKMGVSVQILTELTVMPFQSSLEMPPARK